jgi:hypothetical protein
LESEQIGLFIGDFLLAPFDANKIRGIFCWDQMVTLVTDAESSAAPQGDAALPTPGTGVATFPINRGLVLLANSVISLRYGGTI